jgi:hypothetical protein
MIASPAWACVAIAWLTASFLHAAVPTNLARFGTASGTSEGYGSVFGDAIDGNRNGDFGAGSVWHSLDPDLGPPALSLDLGATKFLDHLTFYPRTDARQNTLTNFRLSVFADNAGVPGSVLWTQNYYTTGTRSADVLGNRAWAVGIPSGVSGRFVKIERLGVPPNFLTFAEMEVWGGTAAPLTNLALTATVSANEPAPGFGASLAAINDGVLGGDYGLSNTSIYHSAAASAGRMVTLELASSAFVDYIQLFPRMDGITTTNMRVTLLDAANQPLAFQDTAFPTGINGFEVNVDFGHVANAKYVTVQTTGSEFLALAEVGVFGSVPEPTSAACLIAGTGLLAARRRRRA